MITIVKSDLDVKLQQDFVLGAEKFANNPLHLKLRGEGEISDKLSFVPRMLFFVMGFKDLMQIVRFDSPETEEQVSVNTHSDEDSYHWQWYLDDLKKINDSFKNAESADLISEVWDDKTLEVRKTIYMFSQHILNTSNPIARMLMVEILELTFDEFKEAIHPVLKNADLYDKLSYFGLEHQETEENHTTGTSDDEIAHLISQLPEDLKEEMLTTVPQLFNQMYAMAEDWAA